MKEQHIWIALIIGLVLLFFMASRRGAKKRKLVLPMLKGVDLGDMKKNLDKWVPDWPKFLYSVVVITVINLMFKWMTETVPKIWEFYYGGGSTFFWTFNFALVLFAFFMSKKDGAGKQIPEARTKARLIMFALIVFTIINFSGRSNLTLPSFPTKVVLNPSPEQDVPAEIALPIICGCESSGIPGVIKHFAEDGKTPLPNKPRPGEKPSSAIGGCQILASAHDERAKSMGFDIRTPEGNLGYAKVLYNESGTKHWEGTPGNTSRGCWGPALGNKYKWEFTVEAPVEKPAEYKLSRGYNLDYSATNRSKRYVAEHVTETGAVIRGEFPSKKTLNVETPTRALRFQSLEREPVFVVLTFTKMK